ncbi:MAG TPA: peptidoglycan-binding protein [Gaiellaceae bacterium]
MRDEGSGLVRRLAVIAALVALAAPATASARSNPQIAGLQVALRAHGLYLAQIDGIAGPKTAAAVHAFQRSRKLAVGVAGASTRKALGPLGGPLFGSRVLRRGDFGWDVAVLQFLLTRSRVYRGALDGYLGKETAASLRRYQRALHLTADAVLGPRTLSAIVERDRVPVRPRTLVVSMTVSSLYTVRAGDNLTMIAERHHTTLAALARANKLDPAKPIIIGRRLRIPATRVARAVTVAAVSPALRSQEVNVPAILDRWSQRLGVDPELTRAVAWMESGYQTRIVSTAGARGVMQTLPSTRAYVETVLLGHRAPATVDGDVEVGVAYLRHLLQVFHGDERLALAGWYQGEKAVRQHGLYKVTKPFVADVLALKSRV